MAKLNPETFAEWLKQKEKNKCGYLMGGVGQKTDTLTTGSWLVHQYAGNAKQYAQAKYWLKNAPRVYDCQGLADHYITKMTGKKTNVYARNNYDKWCGVKGKGIIPGKYRVPGAAVFVHSASAGRITHVGYLEKPVNADLPEGDWYVIEARGVMYGVVRTKLLSRTWNRWGLMDKYFDYAAALRKFHDKAYAPAPEYTLGDRTLKAGMEGEDVRMLQEALMLLGYDLGVRGADGDFGAATEAAVNVFKNTYSLTPNGKVGKGVIRKLEELLPEGEDANDE